MLKSDTRDCKMNLILKRNLLSILRYCEEHILLVWRESSCLFLDTVMSTFSWFLDYTTDRCCCQLISVTHQRLSDPESFRCSVEDSTFKKILFIGLKSNTNASSVQIHRNRPNIIDPLSQALFRECLK